MSADNETDPARVYVAVEDGLIMYGDSSVRLQVPADDLPRVVRELAALMTESQRDALAAEFDKALGMQRYGTTYIKASDEVVPLKMDPRINPRTQEHRAVMRKMVENGPGLSAHPEKSEPLAFLDEDLLCADE